MTKLQEKIKNIKVSDGGVTYDLSATYTLVTTSVATKKTIENGETVIIRKDKPAENGTDRVRVVITAKAGDKVVSEVTKYIDITNP